MVANKRGLSEAQTSSENTPVMQKYSLKAHFFTVQCRTDAIVCSGLDLRM